MVRLLDGYVPIDRETEKYQLVEASVVTAPGRGRIQRRAGVRRGLSPAIGQESFVSLHSPLTLNEAEEGSRRC